MLANWRIVTGLLLCSQCSVSLALGTEMFVCTGADGVRTYQNSDGGQGCVPLNLNPITIVPGTRPGEPDFSSSSSKRSDERTNYRESPSDSFSSSSQVYDYDAKKDRQKILEEELRLESGKLASLQKEYNGGEPERLGSEQNYQKYLDRTDRLSKEIEVTKENIAILRREIDKLLP